MSLEIHPEFEIPQADLRSPDKVMRLERMGSFFPTRLSFMRILLRRLSKENSTVETKIWEFDHQGYGHAVISISFGGYVYSLVAFTNHLDPTERTDRVIAQKWDACFVLYDGVPEKVEIERLQKNATKQEAGRFECRDLILSRANKSMRLFEHVVDRLAIGQQPDCDLICRIGYLMRTTAVYGNGKFGIADRNRITSRPGFSAPFQAEMLLVWLIRGFTHQLVEHVARSKGGEQFVPLDESFKRFLGIGNSTGLGMAPFLVSHPVLLNNWMMVRETALARARGVKKLSAVQISDIKRLSMRVTDHLKDWQVEDQRQMDRVKVLRREWASVSAFLSDVFLNSDYASEQLINASAQWSVECQELIVSLLTEINPELVDGLSECLDSFGEPRLNPTMKLSELRTILSENFKWGLEVDVSSEAANALFWYVSAEKLEPRLGNRYEEQGSELEQPFDIVKRCKALLLDLEKVSKHLSVAEFLIRFPKHRYITRRIQVSKNFPYSEIRDNLIGEICLPIDMLRCKLSFFGASKFDPKSDRWTRITLFQGAPLFSELDQALADDWWLPTLDKEA